MSERSQNRHSRRSLARMGAVLLLGSWAMTGLTGTAAAGNAQGPIDEPGVYRIVNVEAETSLRAYASFRPIFVNSTPQDPGPYELWDIAQTEDGFTIENVGLRDRGAPAYASARQTKEDNLVITSGEPMDWSIESADDDTYVIKAPNEDLLWNADPPVVPLRNADGSDTQRWRFEPADDEQ
ncbi:hypothetical protein ABZ897_45110 [Nonomuraea sp. NPDC046802]|uniref:RICIN domain-containing protein n=1 Tax=Nonomuraea sp. NPDC046802 TaxID=3154919 RepID=UPI003405EEB7